MKLFKKSFAIFFLLATWLCIAYLGHLFAASVHFLTPIAQGKRSSTMNFHIADSVYRYDGNTDTDFKNKGGQK